MKNVTYKFGSNGLYILILVAIFACNIAVIPFGYKLDLSKGRAHTLANSTKNIIHHLKGKTTITFFVSDSLPSRLAPLKREVDDVLGEYKREGGANVLIEKVDPKNDQKKQALAQEFGVAPMSFSQQESDNFAISTAYFGIGIAYNGKKASISQATGVGDLEYNISSSIYKLGVKELPKVGLMGFEGLENQLSTFAQASSSQFQLAPVATPSADLKTLVVFDNDKEFDSSQIAELNSFLNGGGRALVFAGGVHVAEDGGLIAQKAKHSLTGLLRARGITLNEDLVLSTSADFVNFVPQGSQAQIMVPYPYWLRTNAFNKDSSFFTNINQLSFPWVSSTTVKSPAQSLVKSTTQSWHVDRDFNIDPQQIKQPTQAEIKQFSLIARSKGPKNSDLIVVPSSRFISEQYMSRESGNLEFILNVLSEFASGGALAGIRSRAIDYYLIPPMTQQQKDIVKYSNILVLPAIFTALIAMRIYKRNKQTSNTA